VIVVKKYNDPSVKSFNDAKGAVINDYQKFLEDQWIESLKKNILLKSIKRHWEQLLN